MKDFFSDSECLNERQSISNEGEYLRGKGMKGKKGQVNRVSRSVGDGKERARRR